MEIKQQSIPDQFGPPPPQQYVTISPTSANVSLNAGESVNISFTAGWENTEATISLSVGQPPEGLTATLSTTTLTWTRSYQQAFSLTLTAAPDIAPDDATIYIEGTGRTVRGSISFSASVTVNAKAAGQLRPSYQLLSVVYAPPGTNGGKSSSQVSYGSGSTTGTVSSIKNSFKDGVDVSAALGFCAGPVSLGANAEFTASKSDTDSSSIEIKKSSNTQINVPGPSADGIDHGHDMFYLWLNPLLDATADYQGNIEWGIGVDGPVMEIQYVYADWLQDPSLMPPGVAAALGNAGLTAQDYANILACDPFSAGGTVIDLNRFAPTTHSFPYIPPETATDAVPTMTYTQSSATTATGSHEVEVQYGVAVTISAGFKILTSFKVGGNLQWTNTATDAQSTETTQSATVTVGGPAFGYTGPTDVLVYWDSVYDSFMFAFATGTSAASGSLTDKSGKPIAQAPLTLNVGEETFSTFTDAQGNYRFYGAPNGPGTISAGNQRFTVTVGPGESKNRLQLKD